MLEHELQHQYHDDGDDDERDDPEPGPKCQNDQVSPARLPSPLRVERRRQPRLGAVVLLVCVGVDFPSLRFVMFGCGTLLLGALCLLLGAKAFALSAGGLLLGCELGLLGASTARGCLIAMRSRGSATLIKLLGAPPPPSHHHSRGPP